MWNDWKDGVDIFADFFWEGNANKKTEDTQQSTQEDNITTEVETKIDEVSDNKITDIPVENIISEDNNIPFESKEDTNNSTDESFLELFSWWETWKTEIVTEEKEETIWEDTSLSYFWSKEVKETNSVEEEIDLKSLSWKKEDETDDFLKEMITEWDIKVDIEEKKEEKIVTSTDDDFNGIFTPNIPEKKVEDIQQKDVGNDWFETMFSPKKETNISEEKVIQPVEENVQEKTNLTDKLNIDTKKKAIIWIVILVLIIIWGAYSYFWKDTTKLDNWKDTTWNNSWVTTDIVDVNSKISDDEAIKKVLDEYKSKWLAEDLKKTNLEIKDIKVLEDFNWYKEVNVKFILVQYQPILTDEAITSFLVDINKATQEQVKQIKDSWKFEQVKVLMTQYYEKQYGELLRLWTIWVLYKKWEWNYTIMKMWDYFKEKFYNTWVYDVKVKTMMDFIASYISYDKTYFWKDKEKVLQLSNLVMEQLKTEDWKKFLSSVNSYFFVK